MLSSVLTFPLFYTLFVHFGAAYLADITTKQYLKKTDSLRSGKVQASWSQHFYGICCSEVRSKYSVERTMSGKDASYVVGHMPIKRDGDNRV